MTGEPRFDGMDGFPCEPVMSRRAFLGTAASLAVGVLAANHFGVFDSSSGNHESDQHHFPPTFENPAAEIVAKELHITPATYFVVTPETVKAMTNGRFMRHDKLLPTFAPGVRRYEQELTAAAEATNLPVNFLAAITTIESAGDDTARSGADAFGLVQVVPRYHIDGFIQYGYLPKNASYQDYQNAQAGKKSLINVSEYQKAFVDPLASLTVGAAYLRDCLDSAQAAHPELDPDSPVVYAWAASGYNGGIALTEADFSSMPQESQLYVNHVIRILMDVEIAARLSEQGMADGDVVKALWSNEMNARAYAYGQLADKVADYDYRAHLLTEVEPGLPDHSSDPKTDVGEAAHKAYEDYLHNRADVPTPNRLYSIPASPGLRIWLEGGGASLFDRVQANADWRP